MWTVFSVASLAYKHQIFWGYIWGTMSAASRLIVELADVSSVLVSRRNFPGAGGVEQALVQGLRRRIATTPSLSTSGLADFYTALQASALSDEDKCAIRNDLDGLLTANMTGCVKKERKQTIATLNRYLTSLDWQRLEDPRVDAQLMLGIISGRLNLLRVTTVF